MQRVSIETEDTGDDEADDVVSHSEYDKSQGASSSSETSYGHRILQSHI